MAGLIVVKRMPKMPAALGASGDVHLKSMDLGGGDLLGPEASARFASSIPFCAASLTIGQSLVAEMRSCHSIRRTKRIAGMTKS